jgi:hypothetical protein
MWEEGFFGRQFVSKKGARGEGSIVNVSQNIYAGSIAKVTKLISYTSSK